MGSLQEQGGADGERDEGDRDLGPLHAVGKENAGHGGRDDARVAAPAQENQLVARPPPAPVGKEARQDGYGPGDKDKHDHHHDPAEKVPAKRVERQVHAERHEDEQRGYLGGLAHEALQHLGVPLVLLQLEEPHVTDDQTHHEGG